MKRILILGLGLVLSLGASAEDMQLKGMSTTGVKTGVTSKEINMRVYGADSTGSTLTGMRVSLVGDVSSIVKLTPISRTNYNLVSPSATTIGPLSNGDVFNISTNSGAGTLARIAFTTSAVAPTSLTVAGFPVAISATAQAWGPFSAGTYVHAIANYTGAVDITVEIHRVGY